MARVSANHKALFESIALQKRMYDEFRQEYDRMYDEWRNKSDNFDQITKLFDVVEKLKGTKYVLVLTIAAYIEAMINHHLALQRAPKSSLKATFMGKWTNELSKLHTGYCLTSSVEVHQTLVALKEERNAITHMTPKMEDNGNVTDKGFNPSRLDDDKIDRSWIEKFLTLPRDLVGHMEKSIPEHKLRGIKLFSGLVTLK